MAHAWGYTDIIIVNYTYMHTFFPLPEDFCGVDKTVDKYVPVDMNKQV
jgi:hypothetical protein